MKAAVIKSPGEVAVARNAIDGVVVGLADGAKVRTIDIAARAAGDVRWHPLARAHARRFERTSAGVLVRPAASIDPVDIDQLRLTLAMERHATVALARVAVLRRA